jgi:hypothetical protein
VKVQGVGYRVKGAWCIGGGVRPIPIKADDLAASDLREGRREREIEESERGRGEREGRMGWGVVIYRAFSFFPHVITS